MVTNIGMGKDEKQVIFLNGLICIITNNFYVFENCFLQHIKALCIENAGKPTKYCNKINSNCSTPLEQLHVSLQELVWSPWWQAEMYWHVHVQEYPWKIAMPCFKLRTTLQFGLF